MNLCLAFSHMALQYSFYLRYIYPYIKKWNKVWILRLALSNSNVCSIVSSVYLLILFLAAIKIVHHAILVEQILKCVILFSKPSNKIKLVLNALFSTLLKLKTFISILECDVFSNQTYNLLRFCTNAHQFFITFI